MMKFFILILVAFFSTLSTPVSASSYWCTPSEEKELMLKTGAIDSKKKCDDAKGQYDKFVEKYEEFRLDQTKQVEYREYLSKAADAALNYDGICQDYYYKVNSVNSSCGAIGMERARKEIEDVMMQRQDEEDTLANQRRLQEIQKGYTATIPISNPSVSPQPVVKSVSPVKPAIRPVIAPPPATVIATATQPVIQEQVEAQPTVAGVTETVSTPEHGLIRTVFYSVKNSLANLFKKLW